jgi:hypothetical protein
VSSLGARRSYRDPACVCGPEPASRWAHVTQSSRVAGGFLFWLFAKDADIAEVPVVFGVIEPVTDDKFVRNFESDVGDIDRP